MAKSVLIDQFLHAARKGMISPQPDSSAASVLARLCEALQAILDGTDSDDALGVARAPGRSGTIQREMLYWTHLLRDHGEYWSVVECRINLWRNHRGLDPIKASTLQRLYRKHKGAIAKEMRLMRNLPMGSI